MSSKRETTIAGQKVWLCALTGTVAGEKKWSESRTSGGGVSYGPGIGRGVIVSNPIRTTVATRHEFWLVAPDGEERCVQLGNSSISVRENQVLTAVWGSRTGGETGPYLLLRNHNAQNENWLGGDDKAVLRSMKLSDPHLVWSMGGIGAGAALLFLLHSFAIVPLLLAFICAGGGIVLGNQKRKAKTLALREAASAIVSLEMSSRGTGQVLNAASSDPLLPA